MKHLNVQEAQFLKLLEHNKRLIFKIANVYCRKAEDRQDLIQEIILQLWRSYPTFDTTYAQTTWIYRIAINVSISFLRKENTRRKNHAIYRQELELLTCDEGELIGQKLDLLYQLIENLNSFEKAIIILYLEGLKNKEISDVIGISESNVSTKINRIKNKLRSYSNT
ncbi:MAG: sigma-70 family RNA polymerase sigma factor [Saprospiraceae bacterium]